MFARAERLIAERRYAEAVRYCQLQLASTPRSVTLRLLLARALIAEKQILNAVAQARQCLEIDPTCVAARAILADYEGTKSVTMLDEGADRPTDRWQRRMAPPAARPRAPTPSRTSQPAPSRTSQPAPSRTSQPAPSRTSQPAPSFEPLPFPSPVLKAVPPAPHPPRESRREPPREAYREPPREAYREPPRELHREPPREVHREPPREMRREPRREVLRVEPARVEPAPRWIASPLAPLPSPPTKPLPLPPPPPVTAKVPKPRRRPRGMRNAFAAPDSQTRTTPRWQRPLAMETRRSSPLFKLALFAAAGGAVVALWRLRPDDATPLPIAAVAAPAARPIPEPPVVKAEPTVIADLWLHPLAGPERRMPIRDSRLFGAERLGDRPQECRGGHCGIDLAGVYGEPVYAVHDGVVDRVQRAPNPDHGGRYVRLAHQGGTVITQYFHLSTIPRRLEEGAEVKAGEVVGFVGLSGVRHSEPHLHFTIEVRDPSGGDGRYLDPEPLIALWPLRAPGKDDRVKLATAPAGLARGFLRRRAHRHHVAQAETSE